MNNMSFAIANPLASSIQDAEDILGRVLDASERLESAIRRESEARRLAQLANDEYTDAENEELGEVFALAAMKEGPLAGVAVTSEAYKRILAKVCTDLRNTTLTRLWARADDLSHNHERAKAQLAEAEVGFKAIRTVAELKAAALRAACI